MQNYTLVSRYQLLHHAFDFACYSNVKERFRNRAKDARPSHNCLFIPRMPPRKLVGLDRFELSASSLSGTRSNQLSYKPIAYGWLKSGGDDRDRTDDLRLAKAALSQLSYVPPQK